MNAVEILQNHQVKKTGARIAIIEALQEGGTKSEGDIKKQMGVLYDRVTFYRNMQTLEEAGILHKIVANSTTVRYALNCCDLHHQHRVNHVHFYCRRCENLFCVHDTQITDYQLPSGFVVEDCSVVLKGLCKECIAV